MRTLLKILLIVIGAPMAIRSIFWRSVSLMNAIALAQVTYFATHNLHTAFGTFFMLYLVVPLVLPF